MRFFSYLNEERQDKIFYIKPSVFDLDTNKNLLSYALGATLYMPATRKNIGEDLIHRKYPELSSVIICMEDSIDDSDVEYAEKNVFENFQRLNEALAEGLIDIHELPLLFMRVKDVECFKKLTDNIERLHPLCGFVFPKISSKNAEEYFKVLQGIRPHAKNNLYGMPILETPEVMFKESRTNELLTLKAILDSHKELVLNIRVGATDFSSLYAIRREFDQTIYDIAVICNCITDIINVFLRADSGFVISGPVWEYFSSGTRILKPLLRQAAFISEMGEQGLERRSYLIDRYIDGLIKETLLDKSNGLSGKTVIHPSHVSIVNALQVVTREEYEDAVSILESTHKGVHKSTYNNKMNEPKPHTRWAEKILIKSKIYGVLNEERNYTSLFI
ncbi:MAG: HpcH/HpaI aldolase/citrate lyase family protein [Clostridia bacterium]|nr:HpcH/HpaI aldolase/citrate lyase family protein [Clostridia bacterium]